LNRIQRNISGYLLAAETQEKLKNRPAEEITFREVSVSEKKDKVHITVKLSGSPLTQMIALENPLRLVVDLFNTRYIKPTSLYPVSKMGIDKLRIGQFQLLSPHTIARMVFDLSESRYYTITTGENELFFSFYKDDIAQTPPALSTAEPMVPQAPAPAPPVSKPAITEQERPKPEVKAEVKPEAKPEVKPEVKPEYPKEAAVPKVEKVEKPAESVAAPPPKQIPTVPVQEQQEEDQFKPKTITETGEKYTGEVLSLKLKDADLLDVVLYLGYQFGFNVVFDPDARGTVTCDLVGIPWDQALDMFLKQNKMGRTIEGNVLRIAPISVLTREEEENRKLRESLELAQPTVVKTFVLSYSKAKDMKVLLETKKSRKGEIIVDDRTNTLVIEDVKNRMDMLEKLISTFDAPNPQVSIEARVVEATFNFVRNMGIQWGGQGLIDPFYGNQTNLKFPNKIQVDGALIPEGIQTKGIGGPLGGYAINLPAPSFNTALGFSFGNVLDTFRLDMAISALESSGEGRIISSPKIITQNNKQSEIIQGQQIPVQTTANFTTTTRFQNAALELRATPQITAEGTIIMDIEIQNNAPDFGHLVGGIPPITTQRVSTTIMVNDGGTTVIGGIFRTEDSFSRENVPFLHKIPILGILFKNFARTRTNRELLIFITPRIVK
jgi:type IV pilus assembly protein PilQ